MKKQDYELLKRIPVSEHFCLAEVLHTSYPEFQEPFPSECVINLSFMISKMEVIRKCLKRPIQVTSWYRSKRLNDILGGVANSAHKKGLAVDFVATKEEFYFLRDSISYDQLIYYPRRKFIHIGLRYSEPGVPNFRHKAFISDKLIK